MCSEYIVHLGMILQAKKVKYRFSWVKSQDRQFLPLMAFYLWLCDVDSWIREKRQLKTGNYNTMSVVSPRSLSLSHTHEQKKHTYSATRPPHAGVITCRFLNKLKLLLNWMKIENQFFNQFSLQFVTQPTAASERSLGDTETKRKKRRKIKTWLKVYTIRIIDVNHIKMQSRVG